MALGGSINDTNPKIRNPESGKLIGCVVNWNPGGYLLGGSLKLKVPILIHVIAHLIILKGFFKEFPQDKE